MDSIPHSCPHRSVIVVSMLILISSPSADTIPGVPRIRQEMDHWCWAAASQCVLRYYVPGFNKTQSQVAGLITSQDEAPPPEQIVNLLEEHGKGVNLDATMIDGTLSWEEMKTEASNRRPFIMVIRWKTGLYHMNVFAGYLGDSARIKFMDPALGWVYRTYGTTLAIDGDRGAWERTFKMSKNDTTFATRPRFAGGDQGAFSIRYDHGRPVVVLPGPRNAEWRLELVNSAGSCVYRIPVDREAVRLELHDRVAPGAYCARVSGRNLPDHRTRFVVR